MRAAVHHAYGAPDVVHVRDVDMPVPRDDELLVKVHATTVNRTDCGYRAGKPFVVRFFGGLPRPKVRVWGTEFAGEVEAAGRGVSTFAVGDRVFGYSEGTFGAHAEHMTIRADGAVAAVPPNVRFEEAAAGTEGSHYALAFIRKAAITGGQHVLVYGATGAIGSAAVQLLKALGVTVTAVCATAQLELVAGLGADKVVDYTTEDFTRDAQSYDVVIDAVGKSSFRRCRPLLKPRGIYVSSELGPYGQNPLLTVVTPLLRGKTVQFPLPAANREIVEYLRGLIASGAFRPVIDRRFDLDDIVEAYRYVETGRKIGNVVINVVPSDGSTVES